MFNFKGKEIDTLYNKDVKDGDIISGKVRVGHELCLRMNDGESIIYTKIFPLELLFRKNFTRLDFDGIHVSSSEFNWQCSEMLKINDTTSINRDYIKSILVNKNIEETFTVSIKISGIFFKKYKYTISDSNNKIVKIVEV